MTTSAAITNAAAAAAAVSAAAIESSYQTGSAIQVEIKTRLDNIVGAGGDIFTDGVGSQGLIKFTGSLGLDAISLVDRTVEAIKTAAENDTYRATRHAAQVVISPAVNREEGLIVGRTYVFKIICPERETVEWTFDDIRADVPTTTTTTTTAVFNPPPDTTQTLRDKGNSRIFIFVPLEPIEYRLTVVMKSPDVAGFLDTIVMRLPASKFKILNAFIPSIVFIVVTAMFIIFISGFMSLGSTRYRLRQVVTPGSTRFSRGLSGV